jgi:molybdenum cofactor cytidylyltransferase
MLSLIVLAAGKSTRMRGKNKLLEHVNGTPMIRRVVQAALQSKIDEVIVVLGWEASRVREVLADLPCNFVLNKEFESGQSSSVKAGLKAVSNATSALLILPGDVARVDSRSINMVIDAYNETRSAIVVAGHSQEAGHPILFDKNLFHEIEQINEQTYGLKSVVKQHESEVRFVEVGTANVLRDIDTPDDLKELRNSDAPNSSRK